MEKFWFWIQKIMAWYLSQVWIKIQCGILFAESDYAGNPDSRKSIYQSILSMRNISITWRSKSQKSVTFFSPEAKFVILSEAAKEEMLWDNSWKEWELRFLISFLFELIILEQSLCPTMSWPQILEKIFWIKTRFENIQR